MTARRWQDYASGRMDAYWAGTEVFADLDKPADSDRCASCGKVLKVGTWPWCPHEDTSSPAKHGTWFFR